MKNILSRRGFLTGSAALYGSTLFSTKKNQVVNAEEITFPKNFTPHKVSFMDQYYKRLLEIVKGIRETQVDNIAKAMEKAYELKRKGGRIFSHCVYGHYAMFAGSRDRPGQPWVLPQCGITPSKEEFDSMKKGDFLLTNYVYRGTIEAHKRGVYVAGITNSYCQFYKTPPEALEPGKRPAPLEEVSDIVIDSQVDWRNGVVDAPQFPFFKLFPQTGTASMMVYWPCTAVLANLIGTKGKGSSTEPSEQYLDMAINRFQMIGTDRPKMDWVAKKWADLVLGKKARLLVYGHPQDVEKYASRNLFVNEANTCSNGTVIAKPYENYANDLRPNDIVLIGAFTSDNADEIKVARHAKEVGAYTVAFCPYGTDGNSSGVQLFKEVDTAFNTYSDESAGVVAVKGFKEKVSPLTGVTGNLVHWMLTAQWVDHMARRGEMPCFYPPLHEEGKRKYWKILEDLFSKRGY